MPSDETSTPPTELVAGFRIERALGESVWEAWQPELGRRVALRRLPPGARFDGLRWPERDGIVELYAVVDDPGGTYVATQYVEGAHTFAERRAAGARPRELRRVVAAAEATLMGAVHGDLTEHDVLITPGGRVLLTGFGRAGAGAGAGTGTGAEADRAALDRLGPRRRPRTVRWSAVGAVVAAAGAAAVLTIGGNDDDGGNPAAPMQAASAPAPAVAAGATAVGSELAPGALRTVDCEGGRPSGSSEPCTIMQSASPGRPLVAPVSGLVRSWSVRGARGRLSLQVLQPAGDGFVAYNGSPIVTVATADAVRTFATSMSVPRGARFALEVAPGGAVGLRRAARGAVTARFFGPLRGEARVADDSRGRGEELLLRVDVVPRG
ncbi:hypothetical protein DSM112329_01477 [Paraconexibacter sp. AEG42_29]|uniref:Protein kinase domain-containing protein n=1 Tax=Paraconexibacter sp. AEG42_29 TaxID=2997339 RepID=A0AAU7AT27_9ACTN